MVAVNASGCVIVIDAVVVQPLASVTVTIYVPAIKFVAVPPVCAAGVVLHEYEYGTVQPPTNTVAEPFAPPKHKTLVRPSMKALNARAGWVIVTVAVVVHLLASVTVTV